MSFLRRLLRDPETLANESTTRELEKAAEQSSLKVKLLMLGVFGVGVRLCPPLTRTRARA